MYGLVDKFAQMIPVLIFAAVVIALVWAHGWTHDKKDAREEMGFTEKLD